ncbi:GNAT family N-acetyltransferase [Dyella dinghuensis]|uniref:GNAT family N-acetyltransferase n=1 Tax=Dyella dinghuensis TaxID=1920169 RepID=A0A3S0RUN7_9GAMM|nr:GNAT family N-acetyltransferase [Dyella dinghuensis]RUL66014.1 GNAT family N-acetyltransferase [Dyella dinghuensis]
MDYIGKPESKSPSNCSDAEIADFMVLVLAGGEVTQQGLENRVRSAVRLSFLREGESLVGVAALKRPNSEYRSSVASMAGFALPSSNFPYELGWVFILPSARGKKYSLLISKALLASAGTEGVFATSRADNPLMHRTLGKLGFSSSGNAYSSRRGGYKLQLFVREPPIGYFLTIDG